MVCEQSLLSLVRAVDSAVYLDSVSDGIVLMASWLLTALLFEMRDLSASVINDGKGIHSFTF